jgi:protease I
MGNLTNKKVAMVLAPKDFRDEEFFKTRVVLQAKGAQIIAVSKKVEEATGTLGGKAKVDIDIADLKIDDFQALIFIGGSGSKTYFKDKTALQIAAQAAEKGKLLGAICIAPTILANAGVLKGKKATAFLSEKDNLKAKGAIFTGSPVQVDGNIVTASGPAASEEFGKKLAELLAK